MEEHFKSGVSVKLFDVLVKNEKIEFDINELKITLRKINIEDLINKRPIEFYFNDYTPKLDKFFFLHL